MPTREPKLTSRPDAGLDAEDLAARFLAKRGLTVVARNYRCRFGEIDLIARDGATIVFVEVRLRRHRAYGGAAGSIDWRKQRKLLTTARHFLSRQRQHCDPACRFDAILLDALDPPRIEWLRNVMT